MALDPHPKHSTGDDPVGRLLARFPDARHLDGLPALLKPQHGARVVVTEGEPAADALNRRGILAVAIVTGASGTPSDETLRPLLAYAPVLWPDADPQGHGFVQRVGAR